MNGQCVVAVYPSSAAAEQARTELLRRGISEHNLRMSRQGAETAAEQENEGGFFDWLFGGDVRDEDRSFYESHLTGERTALSVYLKTEDAMGPEEIERILEKFDPIDMEEKGTAPMQAPAAKKGRGKADKGKEQVIPLAKEDVEIGKRQVERRHLIRTHIVERPIEQDVHLRDERVVIERRPASGKAVGTNAGLQEREYEVIERSEQPVVSKQVRADEEVVVHKDVQDRVEKVRDTVRETRVDTGKPSAPNRRAGSR